MWWGHNASALRHAGPCGAGPRLAWVCGRLDGVNLLTSDIIGQNGYERLWCHDWWYRVTNAVRTWGCGGYAVRALGEYDLLSLRHKNDSELSYYVVRRQRRWHVGDFVVSINANCHYFGTINGTSAADAAIPPNSLKTLYYLLLLLLLYLFNSIYFSDLQKHIYVPKKVSYFVCTKVSEYVKMWACLWGHICFLVIRNLIRFIPSETS
jgi:hypothetical protein